MEDKLELDPRILVKNLEITKLSQQVDKLISTTTDLNVKLDNYSKEIVGWKANVNDLSQEIVRLTLKLEDYEK